MPLTDAEISQIHTFSGYPGQGFDVPKEWACIARIPLGGIQRFVPIENVYEPILEGETLWAWVPFKSLRAYLRVTGLNHFLSEWYIFRDGKWQGPFGPTTDKTDLDFIFK